MTVNKNLEDGKLTVSIEGRIDTQTAPELEAELRNSLEGVQELVLDFTEVSYISSAGLRTIVTAQNWMDNANGSMKITGVSKNILNIFKVTGFDSFLNIE